MKPLKNLLPFLFIVAAVFCFLSSCYKPELTIKTDIYNGDMIRQRALACNIHDSIFLDLAAPNAIIFQPTSFYSGFSYNEGYANDFEIRIQTGSSYGTNSRVIDTYFTTSSTTPSNYITIIITDYNTQREYISYSGKVTYIYTSSTGSRKVNFCNVLLKMRMEVEVTKEQAPYT